MRSNIVIDDELIAQAMRLTGLKSKREAVETALKELIVHEQRGQLADAFGALRWEGNLDEMRIDRCSSAS